MHLVQITRKLPPRPMPHWEGIAADRFEGSNEVLVREGNPKTFLVVKNLPPESLKQRHVVCLAMRTGQTNYVTPQKIAAPVYDHGREID